MAGQLVKIYKISIDIYTNSKFKFQVAVLTYTPDFARTNTQFGGSLISSKHILTSAWNVHIPNDYFVYLGDTILGNDMDVGDIKTIAVIKKDIPTCFGSDPPYPCNIAILEMAESVPLDQYPNIKPVCLPSPGADFTGSTVTVTGWGDDARNGVDDFNSWLHEVQLTDYTRQRCNGIPNYQICAGVLVGIEAPCWGDDGAPLVVNDPANNNGLTIAGITFYRDGNCQGLETYTKVSYFVNWINGIIGDTTCPPPP